MRSVFITFFVFVCTEVTTAQYTEIINSKRPGFSESPYSIGTDVFQFESGFFYKRSNDPSLTARPSTYGGELFFRYSKFLERLEANVNVIYQFDKVNNPMGDPYFIHGISDLRIGVKYLLYQQKYTDKSKEIRSWKRKMAFDYKRLIPSIALYTGLNTNFVSSSYKKEGIAYKGFVDVYPPFVYAEQNEEVFSYKSGLLLQNDFSDRLVLITNLFVDNIVSDQMFYYYVATITYAMNYEWSFFVENIGKFQDRFNPEYQFGTGLAYLISPNLQVDASVRTNFFENYSYIYASTGVSWRLDQHKDTKPAKNIRTKEPKNNKGGFFSRIFKKKNN